MAAIPKKYSNAKTEFEYKKFEAIDGSHPYKEMTSFSYVEYGAVRRKGGKVRYVNFELLKELELIPRNHPEKLTKNLERAILDCFAITIINEYDLLNNTKHKKEDILDRSYMATRYLQLQNPNKQGVYSGDGRSIWNGYVKTKKGIWDITSCGTGATCLSPATKIHGRFFKTGDPYISYGCGYATKHESIVDALFSSMFAKKSVETERMVCFIEFPDGYAVKVRAGKNLLRPSHIFAPLKQGKIERLTEVVDYYIEREKYNGSKIYSNSNKYDVFLEKFASTFGELAALFEQEYIFCWLDWDGDNIMVNGGLIDFGSIRQFGVYFHEYKFDDDGVWSTSIKQQLSKARNTVQAMAQAIDALESGEKKNIDKFKNHKSLNVFRKAYNHYTTYYFLRRLGFKEEFCKTQAEKVCVDVKNIYKLFSQLERRKASLKTSKTPDGKNTQMVFNMRSFSRDLPGLCRGETFYVENYMTAYAKEHGITITSKDRRNFEKLITVYAKVVKKNNFAVSKLKENAFAWNTDNRVTGDGVCVASEMLVQKLSKTKPHILDRAIRAFTEQQVGNYSNQLYYFDLSAAENREVMSLLDSIIESIEEYKESI